MTKTMTKNDRYLAALAVTNDRELANELDAIRDGPAPNVLSEQFRARLDEDLRDLRESQDQRRRNHHEYLIESQDDLDALWFEVRDFDLLSHLKP